MESVLIITRLFRSISRSGAMASCATVSFVSYGAWQAAKQKKPVKQVCILFASWPHRRGSVCFSFKNFLFRMRYLFCSCNDDEHEHERRCADNERQCRCRLRNSKWLPYKVPFGLWVIPYKVPFGHTTRKQIGVKTDLSITKISN